ncbi:hypothetical protein LTR15_012174 [Elasticomyces elasticus]|nr:hypothetical protein LTR15_012174 [Elasticomyces elasticus]
MSTKIFLTGGTGYIGGSVLDTVVKQHPEYEVTVLLRNVPEKFSKLYPAVKVVRGDYDSTDLISETAAKANIVIHCGNSDHEPSIKALIAGLLRRNEPSFLIHLSGTGIVADYRDDTYHGTENPKIWSDVDDIDAITSMPGIAVHRNVDKIIQNAAAEHGDKLKTAIICPPDIYGRGRGPGGIRSVFFPMFVAEARKVGATFYANDGSNGRSWVHIDDLMVVYMKVVEAAANGGDGADWGKEVSIVIIVPKYADGVLKGYYFASSQEVSQKDIAIEAGKLLHAHGLLSTAESKKLTLSEIGGLMKGHIYYPMIGTYLWASNSRTRSHRAEKLFGYKPSAPTIWETLETDLLASAEK